MEFTSCHHILPNVLVSVLFFLLFSSVFSNKRDNRTFPSDNESIKMRLIKAHLKKVNKPFVKSIQSPDGDIIDCVLTHLQPAFDDHPELKITTPLDSEEPLDVQKNTEIESELKQIWSSKGKSCPHGTIPIRRTSEADILRSTRFSEFGKKFSMQISQKLDGYGHEHAIGFVNKGEYYGAKATLNVWAPKVSSRSDYSSSQVWVSTNIFNHFTNTLEAGWTVNSRVFGDNSTRFFIYWTGDQYYRTGCYNLLCQGFVQTTNKIALGAAIVPESIYDGKQVDITLFIWKSPRYGIWWLKVGSVVVGYWPSTLFPDLGDHATTVTFGGEVFSFQTSPPPHTSTEMGSGHFSNEGFKKASYIRNMRVVDKKLKINSMSGMITKLDNAGCYDITSGFGDKWGSYIFFGGPGNNPDCP